MPYFERYTLKLFLLHFLLYLSLESVYTEEETQAGEAPPPNGTEATFVIVGAGPAGCVLANRLSENSSWTVYLLEAGGIEGPLHQVPVIPGMLQNTDSNWHYKSVPQKSACFGMNNKKCSLPRGKVLGGSSSINFMIYSRGNKRDFDKWDNAGNQGWSHDKVFPYFLRSEGANFQDIKNSPYHNYSGPLSVEHVKYRTVFSHHFVKGAMEAGHNYTDYNGASQLGVSYVQATTLHGSRHSASKSFLDPIRNKRPNLHILTNTTVVKIIIEPANEYAYGVEFLHNNKLRRILSRYETIVSAGVYNTAQLLILSGIGPREQLQSLGIQVIQDLPVGQHLYDHMSFFGPIFTTNTTNSTLFPSRITPKDVSEFQNGSDSTILSIPGGIESLAFIKTPYSQEPKDVPDVELLLLPTSLAGAKGLRNGSNIRDDLYDKYFKPLEGKEHFSVLTLQLQPKSVGRMWLQDRNPFNPPEIDPRYLSNPADVEVILAGIKEAIRISKTPAMQSINATLYSNKMPGCEHLSFGTDDYWRCSIRVLSFNLYHQMSTCKMGVEHDKTSVVSPELKVHGVKGLRVVDTSVIPFPTTSHLGAVSYMIGEKAADMIKKEWKNPKLGFTCYFSEHFKRPC